MRLDLSASHLHPESVTAILDICAEGRVERMLTGEDSEAPPSLFARTDAPFPKHERVVAVAGEPLGEDEHEGSRA